MKDTPQIVVPSGVAGLQFRDEVQTVNALVPELKRQGIEAIVVLIHEGGLPTGDYDECPGISGPIVRIVEQFDAAIDLVVSGHTHRAYNCRIAGRLVTSADKYGTLVTEIDLVLDPTSGDVREARARNLIVRTDRFAKDSAQTQLIEQYERLAAPLAKRSVGRAFAPLTRDESPAGEMPVGQLVADAQLAATSGDGAQLALMNPGGLRATLAGDANGLVRYEDLFAVQPFYNNLVTITLTGAQLQRALEQQWLNQPRPRVLQVSRGFTYSWDAAKPAGERIVPGSLRLNGAAIEPQQKLRVTINSFLAGGGDNFTVFKQDGQEARTGMMDIDALERYVAALGLDRTGLARAHPTRELSLDSNTAVESAGDHSRQTRGRGARQRADRRLRARPGVAQLERGPGGGAGDGDLPARHDARRDDAADPRDGGVGPSARLVARPLRRPAARQALHRRRRRQGQPGAGAAARRLRRGGADGLGARPRPHAAARWTSSRRCPATARRPIARRSSARCATPAARSSAPARASRRPTAGSTRSATPPARWSRCR